MRLDYGPADPQGWMLIGVQDLVSVDEPNFGSLFAGRISIAPEKDRLGRST